MKGFRTMSLLAAIVILFSCLNSASAIISKGVEKVNSKIDDDSNKKADQIDAQASHTHSVYGGIGDNNLGSGFGGGFGGSGLGNYGGNEGYGGLSSYGDHGHHHDHHHYDHHHDHHRDHHDSDGGYHKALAIKGLLIPLAGVALLGAAAAFVSNPILLQLGVISGTYGRRRRREAEHNVDLDESAARLEAQARLNEIQILERFMAQVPKEQMYSQEKKLMASYLSCSGMTEENACLERLACELHGPGAHNMPDETHVMNIVSNEIFNNDLIPAKTKKRMEEAVRLGKEGRDCSVYQCGELEALIRYKLE